MNEWKGNDRIFRTYLKGGGKDGKASAEKHKGIDHVRTFDDAARFKSFGAVLQNGFVDISFDSREMSDAFINIANKKDWRCMVLENPTNGHIHTYWKDTQHRILKYTKDQPLAVGLIADIHGGDTYIPLKVDGVERFPPVYDLEEGEADYQEVPDELLPVNTKISLWQSKEGDGRNNDLYAYILILQSQLDMSPDDIRTMYADCVNPFILAEPLSEDELNVILRDESFDKIEVPSFYNGATFLHNRFGDFLIEQLHIIRLNDQLHIFQDGRYTCDQNILAAAMRKYIPALKKNNKIEVIDYMSDMAPEKQEADAKYIAFKNCIIDIKTGETLAPSPEYVITNIIPWNYDPDAYDELADKTLDKIACGDEQIRMVLEECIGYCFCRSANYNKAFILTGEKSNGKSTFLKVLTALLGDENISSLDLKNLGDRFSKASLYNKLANVGDDISEEFIPDLSLFKKITDGGRIQAENKGQKPFEFNPYCKLLFSANDIPRMKDKTGAVQRRLVIIPFNAKFSADDPDFDPEIKFRLTEEKSMQYLICCGLKGLKRVIEQKGFTRSAAIEKESRQYELENNPILGFINETGVENILNQPTACVYNLYRVYCQECSMLPMTRDGFTKQINKRLNTIVLQKRISGKIIRIFKEQ